MSKAEKELENLQYFKRIMSSYEEIASIRMRRIKNSVLQNRVYLEGLRTVYFQIKYSYNKELQRIKNFKKDRSQIRKTNGKTVAVYLSANTGLYGDILRNTFSAYLDYIKSHETENVIVGKVGKLFYESTGESLAINYFDLSDSGTDLDTQNVLDYLVKYEKIMIFHGRFEDILTQQPYVTSIAGDEIYSLEGVRGPESNAKYIFEPSLESVLIYFENEILGSILEHSFYESNLSKYASRMINLNQAGTRIDEHLQKVHLELFREKHIKQHTNQHERLSSLKVINKV